ncbi:MAG: hypothetical protein FWG56_01120, partial [Desulfovibrionaceae bacterium]|nr:hypothetical protein [Desulfovibrionaceae bacterium]
QNGFQIGRGDGFHAVVPCLMNRRLMGGSLLAASQSLCPVARCKLLFHARLLMSLSQMGCNPCKIAGNSRPDGRVVTALFFWPIHSGRQHTG